MITDVKDVKRLWFGYLVIGVFLGVLLEVASALFHFWRYDPYWMLLLVVLLAFGMGPAMVMLPFRKLRPVKSLFGQFVLGSLLAGITEHINLILNGPGWVFSPAFPLGIDSLWGRTVALGIGGGLFVVAVNLIVRLYHKRGSREQL